MVNLGKDSDAGARKSRGRQRRKSDSVGNKEGMFALDTFEHVMNVLNKKTNLFFSFL